MRHSDAWTRDDALPQLVWITRAADGEAIYVNRQFEACHGSNHALAWRRSPCPLLL